MVARPASHHPYRADLDRALDRTGAARRPLQGRVEIGNVDDVETAELFLGVRIRTVEDFRSTLACPYRAGRCRGLEAVAADQHAGPLQGLGISDVGARVRAARLARSESLFVA